MRRIAASMAFDGYQWINKPLVRLDDNGVITDVGRFDPEKSEPSLTEYYHGILTPGFFNAHTHIELSFNGAVFSKKTGMSDFINHVRWCREHLQQPNDDTIGTQIRKIKHAGTIAISDVMNDGLALELLEKSAIKNLNFFEYFMLSEKQLQKQDERFNALMKHHPESRIFSALHAPYTLTSKNTLALKKALSGWQKFSALHFKESREEIQLYSQKGELYNLYKELEKNYQPEMSANNLIDDIFEVFKHTGKLVFVHNTFISSHDVNKIKHQMKKTGKKVAFALCPRSNESISGVQPPYDTLRATGLPVMLGTDSLLSAPSLSIFDELKFVHQRRPDIPLEELLKWITLNPARFFAMDDTMGSIEPGKKPGINLIHGSGITAERLPENAEIKVLV